MLALLLAAQLALQLPPQPPGDSVYSSAALRRMVAWSAGANAAPPGALTGYRAHVESEMALLVSDTAGRERAAQLEQFASDATWSRSGYALHVVGSRTQSVGVALSVLTVLRGWTVPLLYGNRLQLGIEGPKGADAIVTRGPGGRPDTLRLVHPFAADRDAYYRFSGGDTVAVVRSASGPVPIARIMVAPRANAALRFAGFRGEIEIDARRGAIVRMRGRFEYPGLTGHGWRALSARATGLDGVAYVELVNALVGDVWLPSFQRTEFQATAALFSPDRSVLRVVSSFTNYQLDTSRAIALADSGHALSDSALVPHVTFAAADTVDAYTGWRQPLGRATSALASRDFDDVAPAAWKASGAPEFIPYPRRFGDVLRFNRVEGAYTGLAGEERFRDVAPGVVARAFGGWAWTERTARGGAEILWQQPRTTYALHAERALASTNDFRAPLEGGASLGALLGSVDDDDYVDRRWVGASVVRRADASSVLTAAEVGVGDDRPEMARLTHGLFDAGAAFRPNRGVAPGRYARASVDIEYHPNVSGDFLEPGLGARLHVEHGQGALTWTRTELTVASRRYWNDAWIAVRASGGIVAGANIPPQTLFEIGGTSDLPGYTYKEFGGDRAALSRVAAGYTFPFRRTPRRIFRGLVIPGLSPGVAAGVAGGWAGATSGAWRSLRLLGINDVGTSTTAIPVPVSVPTNGVRATVDLRVTFFSGALGIGVARSVDHPAPWRAIFALGQSY